MPESKAQIAVSVDSLLKLPQGATYSRKSGQARVEAAIRGDTVYITGTCDSLARQVEYYENLYHTARDALKHNQNALKTEKERQSNGVIMAVGTGFLGFLAGFITCVIITAIVKPFSNKPQ